jgi:MraZ protein
MLVGQYETKLSAKRRVAIPYKIRKELGKGIIIARWYEGCLVMIGEEGWSELSYKLTKTAMFVTQPVRDTDRFILGSAFEVIPDAQGRVVLPQNLATYAKMKDEVVFVGLGKRVEIWDKDMWTKREAYIAENAAEYIEKIAKEVSP